MTTRSTPSRTTCGVERPQGCPGQARARRRVCSNGATMRRTPIDTDLDYFFFRRTIFFADFLFAGRRLATAFRLTVFLAFFALARRFTVLRFFFAGPTSRRAPRTAVSAAPVTAKAAVFAAPDA